jgi:hypothetical protein
MPKKKKSLLPDEFKEQVGNEIIRDALMQDMAETVAKAETRKVKPITPHTIILRENYVHPKTPVCEGCPHPDGRYVHPKTQECELKPHSHPLQKHDHKGDSLEPERINPMYCTLHGMSQHGNEYHTPDFGLVHETHITFVAVATEVAF